ncbi:MAG TPA: hypothetical protein VKA83_06095 [Methylomirabilota bacterium]|jgi:hypothetical protein|nr:hypothetical protein [Methylomirabilota bacterium]HJR01180.1 hypothetical protein [Methylomirabilota bacterium]
MPISLEQARAAKESAKALLTALPGVVGVGITKVGEDYALKVNLREPLPAGVSAPERIGDVPVKLEVVGRISRRG